MRFPVFSVPAGKTALEISLPRLIAGDRLLAEDVRLTVKGRERVCIVGRNGCGKSSLLRIAAQAGEERRAFYMPQDYDEVLPAGHDGAYLSGDAGRRGGAANTLPPVSAVCTLRGRKWSGTSPRCPAGSAPSCC